MEIVNVFPKKKKKKKFQDTKNSVDPCPKEFKAEWTKLKLALQMIPFRGVQEDIDPPSYRMPTRTKEIQEHRTRLNLRAPITTRKRALYIARKFADRLEREDQDQVQNLLQELGQQLQNMKTRILDINDHHLNAPDTKFGTLTDDGTKTES
ncbi:hypothetical protein KC19_VG232400 [Ceratodon purpureus]|uniref:Uncharacterized protein n=1 Tax=Ceratodon purpureus TaxID=3225 RepID=A0A8T0HSS7_CERPU|nr:hypothetical protein KC19_VG232400 [Ceratodon purpureus]KAG0574080.1 hypothetical protein KC19_VG232400 [Ceratodon purpureus]